MTILFRKTNDEECIGSISLDHGDQLLAYPITVDGGVKEMCFIHIDSNGEVIDNHLIGQNNTLTLNGHFKALAWQERWVEKLDGYYVAIALFEGGK